MDELEYIKNFKHFACFSIGVLFFPYMFFFFVLFLYKSEMLILYLLNA